MRKLPPKSFFKNKRVLVRVDFNVEIRNNKVVDDFDIWRAMKTIKHVASQSNYVLLISHLGNPKEGEKLMSLAPVAHHLSGLLRKKVRLIFGRPKDLKQSLSALPKGSIVLLENIRFYSGEYSRGKYIDSKSFAKELASLGDCYVNEAFGESHRKVSTISAITKFLPSFVGFNFQDEIKHLDKLKTGFRKTLVLILGGAKMKTKLPLIKSFVKRVKLPQGRNPVPKQSFWYGADYILLGGALANTFLKAKGFDIGRSLYEKKFVNEAKRLLKHKNIILPTDFLVASSKKSKKSASFDLIRNSQFAIRNFIFDLGPQTVKQYQEIIKSARTIIWNGPMGYYENPVFARGTKAVAKAVFSNKKAFKVIGGGDSTAFLRNADIRHPTSDIRHLFISTGGGAMLEYLSGSPSRSPSAGGRSAGKKLPGIVAIEKSEPRQRSGKH